MTKQARPALLTPAEFAGIGRMLYGDHWILPMAQLLNTTRRTIERLVKEKQPVHAGIAADLLAAIEDLVSGQRHATLRAEAKWLAGKLRQAAKATTPG